MINNITVKYLNDEIRKSLTDEEEKDYIESANHKFRDLADEFNQKNAGIELHFDVIGKPPLITVVNIDDELRSKISE